jgi:large subunit ribosomal protein L25
MTFSLTVQPRTERGKKLTNLRRAGKLPAIVYGPKNEPLPLTLDRGEFERLFKETGESSVISLTGLSAPLEVIVHEVAFDPAKGGVVHVDFYAPEAGKEMHVDVPLEFVGEAPAVKLGGTLTKVLHEVEVICLPTHIPQHLTVDVSVLDDFEKQIHVRDIVVPQGVRMHNDPEDVVVLVQAVTEDTAEPVTLDMSAIEVEKKGKKEEVVTE